VKGRKQTGSRCNYKAAVALQRPVRNGEERQRTGCGCTVLVPRVSAWRIAMKLRFCRSDAHRGRVGPGNFTPSRSQIPDVNLSIHSARVPHGRLPPSVETSELLRLPVDPIDLDARDLPPSLHGNCPGSSLLRSSPSLAGASVLSASRGCRLCLFL
jgi:hypothetical protein